MTANQHHRALPEAFAASRAAEHRLATLLLEMSDQGLFRELGHPSMAANAYASFELASFRLKEDAATDCVL